MKNRVMQRAVKGVMIASLIAGGTTLAGAHHSAAAFDTTLKPGDKPTITIRPMKNGEKGGMWVTAKRPDGEVLLMNGEIKEP